MSCRVFQRRLEYAFLSWLGTRDNAPRALEFASTPRNEPMRRFLESPAFRRNADGLIAVDLAEFQRIHAADLALFALTPPGRIPAGRTR
jgi:predicted enzyme involved in methoxymalonyl-ACP biosynthesis